jgi:hypothetical protein
MAPDVSKVELYAWVGEDELANDGKLVLKQTKTPGGSIPLVATNEAQLLGNKVPQSLQLQATIFNKPVMLCRFVFAEELVVLKPRVEPDEPPEHKPD